MSETKHTPGPWRINDDSSDCGADKLSIETSDEYFIAQVDPGAQQRENARLIAAAPELLAALKSMVKLIDDNGLCVDECEDYDNALAAIAKATGSAA